MKLIFTTVLTICSMYINAQVYATEALRLKAEKNTKAKQENIINPNTVVGVYIEKEAEAINEKIWNEAYALISIDALDPNAKHSAEEMKEFQIEAQEEFQKTEIRISKDFTYIIFKSKNDASKYSTKKIQLKDGIIKYVNCEKCASFTFKVIEKNDMYLVVETKSQDEGTYYFTRLTLKK